MVQFESSAWGRSECPRHPVRMAVFRRPSSESAVLVKIALTMNIRRSEPGGPPPRPGARTPRLAESVHKQGKDQ